MSDLFKPAAQFSASIHDIRDLAAQLIQACDDHFGVAPEAVHFGHVGDANRVLCAMREINEMLSHTDHSGKAWAELT